MAQDGSQGPALAYARTCLQRLGWPSWPVLDDQACGEEQAWTDSGLAELTGLPERQLMCPVPLASQADGLVLALRHVSAREPTALPEDRSTPIRFPLGRRLLGMRRLSHPLRRQGRISANGSCRLVTLRDGTLAVNLPREDDWCMLPAWLEDESITGWPALERALAGRGEAEMLERARWLGLAVAPLTDPPAPDDWHTVWAQGPQQLPKRDHRPLVLDLSSLWAGPLCTHLLHQTGARVIKVEHPGRLDGARQGPAAFFRALDTGKEHIALDLSRARDHARLLELLQRADIVIEGMRPRVLQQYGIDAVRWVEQGGGRTWLSITGYGRGEAEQDWVAFGDDAAVAGGLSEIMRQRYAEAVFVGDAIADPLAGLHAALAASVAYRRGGGQLIGISMAAAVAHCISQRSSLPGWPVAASDARQPDS